MQETKHKILISERAVAEIDGVSGIRSFDENGISLESTMGKIILEGKDLKIENMDKSLGRVVIVGNIDAVYYSASTKKSKGIFK